MASDEQLVRRMAGRDEAALVQLHRRYAPYLLAMARKMLDDPDECRQSVEDAFVGAWHAAARFDPSQASARTWLVTLAYRLTMTRMRGGRLEAALESRDAPSRSPDQAPEQVPDQMPDHTGRAQLREAVGELSRDERELIGLAFYRGYSYQELADITGYPLDTVKAKLRLALDKLKARLQGGSDED